MSADHSYELLCLENPLLDIQAEGDEALLKQYGLKANDAILAEDQHMALFDELVRRDAKLMAGGGAQNTARGAQYILAPESVVFFGCVGKDKNAEILQSANEEAGVAVRYLYDPKQPTGRCGAIITGHSRSLCTDLAAANCYKLEHLMENWKVVENAKAYYVGGYHLTVCVPAALALAEEAAKTNKPFIFSLSAPFIPEVFKEPLDKIAPFWDYIVGNETEALSYANSHDLGTEDLPAIARAIANLPKKNDKRKRVAIITQGTDPTIVAVQGESESDVKTFQVRPIPRAEIVDTTGAGDAFLGGFIAGIVEHAGLEKSIDMGQWLAALSIRELGPCFPYPRKTYSPA